MKRPLVLTTESARHPFRQRLPRHISQVRPEPKRRSALGFFGISYLGSFLVIMGFIA